MREYYQTHKVECKTHTKRYKKANPDKVRKWNKDHDQRRPDLVQARQARNHKKHYPERKDKLRARALKYLYGLTVEEYNQRVANQNSVCAICKEPPTARTVRGNGIANRLCVDHNHETGKVRSLLCADCNLMIGQLEKKLEYIPAMIQYLESYK